VHEAAPRRRAWIDAVIAFDADQGARVRCPDCEHGWLSATWVSAGPSSSGEVIVRCDGCGAYTAALRHDGPPPAWDHRRDVP
jgi:hypothetical protein